MWNFIVSLAKVCFRNGENIINFIQEVYAEMGKNSPASKELSDMEDQILDSEEV